MSACYNLISCSPANPDILGVSDSILSGYINELVSINGDTTKKYYVRETHQLIVSEPDRIAFLCGASPTLQYRISSIFYNGVQQVTSPQLYNLNISNIQLITCSGTNCVTTVCPTGTNCQNFSTFLNNVFTLFGIPLSANPIWSPILISGSGALSINSNTLDNFQITLERTAGPLSPMTYVFGIDISGDIIFTIDDANNGYADITLDYCVGTILGITSISNETVCSDLCGCPLGYTVSDDGSECTILENVSPIQYATTYIAGPGTFATNFYGSETGQFYEDITLKPWPIIATNGACPIIPGTCSILNDNALVPLVVTNMVANPVWGGVAGSTANFRIKVAGIWTTLAPSPINEWIGFTYCVDITTTKTYYLAFAVDDVTKFYLDGNLMIDHSAVGWSFRTWKIIPITINAGTHIFDGRVLNSGGAATFAFEIYEATLAQLLAVAIPGDLDPYIVFSTKDYIGQSWQTGEVSGYTCPDGYSLNTCDGLVCSRIITVPSEPCCFMLTDCKTGVGIITDTDLLTYIGQTIVIEGFTNCFVVSISEYECILPTQVVVTEVYTSCDQCSPCYILTNCRNPSITIKVTNDLLSIIDSVVSINGDCWIITGPAPDCVGALPVVIDKLYGTCYECLSKCYILTKCIDPSFSVTVSTNLSQYVGQVVHLANCGNTCWFVEETIECEECLSVEVIEFFIDCESCAPPIPELPEIELHIRKVKPGYDTPACSPEYTEKVNCKYGEYLYNEVMTKRHGIFMCCQEDALKWEIKKNLLDLKVMYDPDLCKSTLNRCCPPTCVESLLYIFQAVSCPAPTSVVSDLDVPINCLAPTPGEIRSIFSIDKFQDNPEL